jgi:hypothetical protein
MEHVMQAYPGGRSEIVRTHVRPSSYPLNPVVGFTFLARFDTKGIILLLVNGDQDLTISFVSLRREVELTLLCIRTPPLLELASWNKCLVTAFQLCPINMVPPPFHISLTSQARKTAAHLPAKLTSGDSCQAREQDFHRRPFFRLGFPN